MKITKIKSRWREPEGFSLKRQDIGDEYIFIHFLSPVELLIDGENVQVYEGSCIMYDKHSYQYMHSSGVLLHDWMHIKGELDNIVQKYDFKYNTIYKVRNSGIISDIVREIEEESMINSDFSPQLIELKLEELILKTVRESNDEVRTSCVNADTVRRFLSFRIKMNREYKKQWTIPEMAENLGFSQAQFCKLYKEIFKISPKRDLQLVRLEQAKVLLMQNEYMVSTIAQMCGYTNSFHFIRTFKKETGMTPCEYSKNHK